MAEKILLIQPRWMTDSMTRQKVQFWREKYPRATFTLLSKSPLENVPVINWILPPLEPQTIVRFARQLRRVRFRRAIILTDSGHGDVGYGEAKVWAFAANARWRDFEGQPLTIRREIKAKRKVMLTWNAYTMVALFDMMKVQPRPLFTAHEEEIWKDARTFVYLHYAVHQHGAVPNHVLLLGEDWSAAAARRCGWEVTQEKTTVDLALVTEHEALSLNAFNVKLACVSTLKSPLCDFLTMHQIENRAAFFDEEARDIWLEKTL